MMNTNTDTVLKLSDALTELIAAYEKLQKENDDLNAKNEALQSEINELKEEKTSLESTYNQLNETTEKQENNINSMLGKIESLLGVNKSKKELQDIIVEEASKFEDDDDNELKDEAQELEESIFNSPAQHETSSDISDIALNGLNKKENDDYLEDNKKEEEDNNKLDLNRMASLLNGFNK